MGEQRYMIICLHPQGDASCCRSDFSLYHAAAAMTPSAQVILIADITDINRLHNTVV